MFQFIWMTNKNSPAPEFFSLIPAFPKATGHFRAGPENRPLKNEVKRFGPNKCDRIVIFHRKS